MSIGGTQTDTALLQKKHATHATFLVDPNNAILVFLTREKNAPYRHDPEKFSLFPTVSSLKSPYSPCNHRVDLPAFSIIYAYE